MKVVGDIDDSVFLATSGVWEDKDEVKPSKWKTGACQYVLPIYDNRLPNDSNPTLRFLC